MLTVASSVLSGGGCREDSSVAKNVKRKFVKELNSSFVELWT